MNKVLIITTGRTGSTNLSKGISSTLNYKFYDEPFHIDKENSHNILLQKIKNESNIVVKHIWYHRINNTIIDDFLKLLISEFDEVFILLRKNSKEHYESIINLQYKKEIQKNVFEKYNYDDIPDSFIKKYKNKFPIDSLIYQIQYLEKFSNDNNIKKIYYENIYSKDINSNFKIIKKILPNIKENIKNFLDINKRQRFFGSKYKI